MLNKLWGFMILLGILFAAATGHIGDVGTAAIDSSKEAVTLCVTMLGIMSMWTGLMNIAKKAGIIDALTRGLRPVLAFLFPGVPREHKANEYMAANMISNVLGLGWAATPVGLKVDSGKYYCVPQSVWFCFADVNYRHGAGGDISIHGCRRYFLGNCA